MATNKNAQIRYHALDRCLGNWSKRYYIEDLIEACNDALYDYNGSEGVKKRQVQADLDLIHDALMVMKRLEGMPHLEWLDDLDKRLYSTSRLQDGADAVVSFQHNSYLKGMEDFYKPIFDAIVMNIPQAP